MNGCPNIGKAYLRVLIGIGGGVAVGLLFLVQTLGIAYWCPAVVFTILHFPLSVLVLALSQGEFVLGKTPSPYGVVVQWTLLGALLGVLLHRKQRSKASAHLSDFNKGQATPSVPKNSFSIVRVICVIVALLLLLSLLFWAWVLLSPHR
jgi:hypothetical protein